MPTKQLKNMTENKTEKELDRFSDNIIKIQSKSLAEKDKIIYLWKRRAENLSKASKLCINCTTFADRLINNLCPDCKQYEIK